MIRDRARAALIEAFAQDKELPHRRRFLPCRARCNRAPAYVLTIGTTEESCSLPFSVEGSSSRVEIRRRSRDPRLDPGPQRGARPSVDRRASRRARPSSHGRPIGVRLDLSGCRWPAARREKARGSRSARPARSVGLFIAGRDLWATLDVAVRQIDARLLGRPDAARPRSIDRLRSTSARLDDDAAHLSVSEASFCDIAGNVAPARCRGLRGCTPRRPTGCRAPRPGVMIGADGVSMTPMPTAWWLGSSLGAGLDRVCSRVGSAAGPPPRPRLAVGVVAPGFSYSLPSSTSDSTFRRTCSAASAGSAVRPCSRSASPMRSGSAPRPPLDRGDIDAVGPISVVATASDAAVAASAVSPSSHPPGIGVDHPQAVRDRSPLSSVSSGGVGWGTARGLTNSGARTRAWPAAR
jgi:hypothetical protein